MDLRHCVVRFDRSKSAGFLVNHLARLFANRLQAGIAPLGIAPAQFMTLLELWEGDGLTQADLVERLDVEQATLANTLKRMQRDGLIRCTDHPQDKRAKLIWLTDHARALEARAKKAASEVNRSALAELPAAERDAFIKTLGKLIASMRRGSH